MAPKPSIQPQNHFIDPDNYLSYRHLLQFVEGDQGTHINNNSRKTSDEQALRTAPLFTSRVHAYTVKHIDTELGAGRPVYPQYGLLGVIADNNDDSAPAAKLVFGNTSEPWSAFICGSQGSGKSYTLSCLLENMLSSTSLTNKARSLATGIVLHYDQFAGARSSQPCEAAYLCSTNIRVTVLVCPTSVRAMTERYENLPRLPERSVKPRVLPLLLRDEQLSTEIIMTLMGINDVDERTPLYIASVRQLLRQMVLDKPDNPVFDYEDFIRRLNHLSLTKDQLAPLNLRLDLLRSVLVSGAGIVSSRATYDEVWQPQPGTLTVVDLSDPFVTRNDACALFSISLKLFMAGRSTAPRIIALDEAHKFLRSSIEAQKLTADLVSVIRQQRHLGSRVVVATQEPTVSGDLLSLCNVSIVHRFTSPQWYSTLRQHLAGAYKDSDDQRLLEEIIALRTGQAMIFCPTAVLDVDCEDGRPVLLRDTYFKLAIKRRAGIDGGESILPSHDLKHQGSRIAEQDTTKQGLFNSGEKFETESLSSDGINSTIEDCSQASRAHDDSFRGLHVRPQSDGNRQEQLLPSISSRETKNSPLHHITLRELEDRSHAVTAFMHKTSNIAMVHEKRIWTELELENLISDQIQDILGANPVKDPWPIVVAPAFRTLEKICAVPERFFADNVLYEGCRDGRPIDMMKRLLKKYYDDLKVPREKRAAKTWLRD